MKFLSEAILKPKHREAGLCLGEDDHTVYLKQGSKVLARWSAAGATQESILSVADEYIKKQNGN